MAETEWLVRADSTASGMGSLCAGIQNRLWALLNLAHDLRMWWLPWARQHFFTYSFTSPWKPCIQTLPCCPSINNTSSLHHRTGRLQWEHTPKLPWIGLHKNKSCGKVCRAEPSPSPHCVRTGTEYTLYTDWDNTVRYWIPLNLHFREKTIF